MAVLDLGLSDLTFNNHKNTPTNTDDVDKPTTKRRKKGNKSKNANSKFVEDGKLFYNSLSENQRKFIMSKWQSLVFLHLLGVYSITDSRAIPKLDETGHSTGESERVLSPKPVGVAIYLKEDTEIPYLPVYPNHVEAYTHMPLEEVKKMVTFKKELAGTTVYLQMMEVYLLLIKPEYAGLFDADVKGCQYAYLTQKTQNVGTKQCIPTPSINLQHASSKATTVPMDSIEVQTTKTGKKRIISAKILEGYERFEPVIRKGRKKAVPRPQYEKTDTITLPNMAYAALSMCKEFGYPVPEWEGEKEPQKISKNLPHDNVNPPQNTVSMYSALNMCQQFGYDVPEATDAGNEEKTTAGAETE